MPNLKIFADQALGVETTAALRARLPALRTLVCKQLNVPIPLAQLAIVTVFGMGDQAQMAVEMQILPKAERTAEKIEETCSLVRSMLQEIANVAVAFRVTIVDPQAYFVFR